MLSPASETLLHKNTKAYRTMIANTTDFTRRSSVKMDGWMDGREESSHLHLFFIT